MLKVVVKTRMPEDSIGGWDAEKQALVVHLKAPAQEGKANRALLQLLSREFQAEARIVKGFTSREKYVKIIKR